MNEFLIGVGVSAAISIITSILTAFIKKGKFENWGYTVGKSLSKFAGSKMGAKKWEKIEDVITLSILSFAKGIKQGADRDDEGNKLNKNKTENQ